MKAILFLILSALWIQGAEFPDQPFFYADKGVYYLIKNAEPAALTSIPTGITLVSWTPDGQYLTYFEDNRYHLIDVAADQEVYATTLDLAYAQTPPIWSRDGRHFVVKEIRFINEDDYVEGLVLVTVDEAYQVMDSQRIYEGAAVSISWSPDGTRLAFVKQFVSTNPTAEVYVYDVTTMTLTIHPIKVPMAFQVDMVQWWDDEHIVFAGQDGFYLLDLTTDTTQLRYLTNNSQPRYSYWDIAPDHTRLVFDGKLYAITASGLEYLNLVDGGTAWSTDSQYFLTYVTHLGSACYDNGIRCVFYTTVTLDTVLNDRDGNQVALIAQDVSVVGFDWCP